MNRIRGLSAADSIVFSLAIAFFKAFSDNVTDTLDQPLLKSKIMSIANMSPVDDGDVKSILANLYDMVPAQTSNGVTGSGLDRSKYNSATAICRMDGKSLASGAPSIQADKGVMRGVILPASTEDGGSLGLDAKSPHVAHIDPGVDGFRSFSIDMKEFTNEQVKEAYDKANKEYPANMNARAVTTYAILASMKKQESLPKVSVSPLSISKEASVLQPVEQTPQSGSILAAVNNKNLGKVAMAQPTQQLRKVDFELPKPFGMFTCYYHDVVRTPSLLVLIYNQASGAMKWFPQVDLANLENQVPIGVLVYDQSGAPDTAFAVLATPVRFSYQNLEFCVLAIENEKSYKTPQPRIENEGHPTIATL